MRERLVTDRIGGPPLDPPDTSDEPCGWWVTVSLKVTASEHQVESLRDDLLDGTGWDGVRDALVERIEQRLGRRGMGAGWDVGRMVWEFEPD